MNKLKQYLWKRILATVAKNVGWLNLCMRMVEFVLRNVNQTWRIPYEGYANDIVGQTKKIVDDGQVETAEIADMIKFFRTGAE